MKKISLGFICAIITGALIISALPFAGSLADYDFVCTFLSEQKGDDLDEAIDELMEKAGE